MTLRTRAFRTRSSSTRKSIAVVGIGALALIGVAGCASDDATEDTASPTTSIEVESEPETTSPTTEAEPAGLVGPGCAAYAEQVPTGPGSVEAMAEEPVATAASNSPLLTTLTAAVSGQLNPDVDLVETLNGGEFTVFAPVDDAFAALDPATLETLTTDAPLLTDILTYHVVPGQATPSDIAGEHTTVQGGTVEVTGSGDDWQVNDANVVCGGIQTANAVVYLIDGVLTPQ